MKEEYQVLMRRIAECEALAQETSDQSVRAKCAQLAKVYREMAQRMKGYEPTFHWDRSLDLAITSFLHFCLCQIRGGPAASAMARNLRRTGSW